MAGEPAKTSSAYWRWALAAGVPVAWYLYSRGRKAEDERTDSECPDGVPVGVTCTHWETTCYLSSGPRLPASTTRAIPVSRFMPSFLALPSSLLTTSALRFPFTVDAFFKAPEPVGSTGSRPVGGGLQSGPIDAFFRNAGEEVDTRNPLDFDSFLVGNKRGAAGKAASATAAPAKPKEAGPSPEMKPVTVLYGTEFGFSKEIAEKLCSQLKAAGCKLWWVWAAGLNGTDADLPWLARGSHRTAA